MNRTACGVILIGSFLFAGCATTRVTDSWTNPEFKGNLSFKKIAVMAIASGETNRRILEDELTSFIGSERAVASYQFLALEDLKDVEKDKAALKKIGADGLVMIRPVDVRQEVNYVPGTIAPSYHSPWGYSSMAWGHGYPSDYVTTDTIVRLETNIYSLADEKLIWSGVSETFNPSNLRVEAKNLARVIQARLKKEKLLPQ